MSTQNLGRWERLFSVALGLAGVRNGFRRGGRAAPATARGPRCRCPMGRKNAAKCAGRRCKRTKRSAPSLGP